MAKHIGQIDSLAGTCKWMSFLAISFAAVHLAMSQTSADKPPVPYASGTEAREGVFLDPQTGDGVLLYSDAQHPEPTRISVVLGRHIEPHVVSEVTYDISNGIYEYKFLLENGSQAKQTAQLWYFDRITDSDTISVAVPSEWEYHFPFQSQSTSESSESNLSTHALCIIVDSLSPSSTKGVSPGEKRRGLLLKSTLLPGLTDVYVQGRTPILALPGEPDGSIAEQLTKLTGFPYNYRHAFAFCPRYNRSWAPQALASDYLTDLQRLRQAGLITSNSFYTAAAILLNKWKTATPKMAEIEQLKQVANDPYAFQFADILRRVFDSKE
jgi:hypothetical protein